MPLSSLIANSNASSNARRTSTVSAHLRSNLAAMCNCIVLYALIMLCTTPRDEQADHDRDVRCIPHSRPMPSTVPSPGPRPNARSDHDGSTTIPAVPRGTRFPWVPARSDFSRSTIGRASTSRYVGKRSRRGSSIRPAEGGNSAGAADVADVADGPDIADGADVADGSDSTDRELGVETGAGRECTLTM
jgi:hypothetical protein